jgi:hypothetical protein
LSTTRQKKDRFWKEIPKKYELLNVKHDCSNPQKRPVRF